MLSSSKIIAIDDEKTHLDGLADGLNAHGYSCTKFQFEDGGQGIKKCQYVRVVFADLHLDAGGDMDNNSKHFGTIGGIVETKLVPQGPYMIVLWTKYPDQASALLTFLQERLEEVPAPFAVFPLDKKEHLDANGKVKDVAALISAIDEAIKSQPQIAALMNWEHKVSGATSETISTMFNLGVSGPDGETPQARLARLLAALAQEAAGSDRGLVNKFELINEVLLPILSDRIGSLKTNDDERELWDFAIPGDEDKKPLNQIEAGLLNRLSHIAEGEQLTGDMRGVVIDLPDEMSGELFHQTFGLTAQDAAEKEFCCAKYDPAPDKCKWRLIQIQAPCDYAQKKSGPRPYALCLELDIGMRKTSTPPDAVWRSPEFYTKQRAWQLIANARFQITMPENKAKTYNSSLRLRGDLLSQLIFRVQSYGARPGILAFSGKPQPTKSDAKAKTNPQNKKAPANNNTPASKLPGADGAT